MSSKSQSSPKKTTQKPSKKRKNVETEGASSSATRQQPKRLAREDSVLAGATGDLRINSGSSSSSRSSYSVKDLPSSSSVFATEDMEALNAIFIPASSADEVIPDVEVTEFSEQYLLPKIGRKILGHTSFDVRELKTISNPEVQTFLTKLNNVVLNDVQVVGTDETFTDTYVDNLLRIVKLDNFPLMIRNQPPRKLYIQDVAKVTSVPDFVIEKKNNQNRNIVVIDDKHLKNIGPVNGFGETQIAVEILACGSENIRSIGGEEYTDQTLWAVRIISTYVTFYKALIPAMYWEELGKGLPKKQSMTVQRWPAGNGLKTGFDFAQPKGRRAVLTALAKIRESLLQEVEEEVEEGEEGEEDEQLSS